MHTIATPLLVCMIATRSFGTGTLNGIEYTIEIIYTADANGMEYRINIIYIFHTADANHLHIRQDA